MKAAEKDAEGAYRELVDRLLRSPHYGERWGRWWLDQARYADSNGYSIDAPRQIWKFRDWVIDALNADMPFDQFTIEQLAGDLLPNATESQKIATGFHRNTQINQEGGIDKEQFRIDSVFDRVATTGTVWLGLTIGCAQCHDHKFDPIEQKEYYRLFAFLNNQDEPTMKVRSGVGDGAEGGSWRHSRASRAQCSGNRLSRSSRTARRQDHAALKRTVARTPSPRPGADRFRINDTRITTLNRCYDAGHEERRAAQDHRLHQGDFTRPRMRSRRARRVLHRSRTTGQQSARSAAGSSARESAHRPRDREPHLAAVFRPRHRGDGE